MYILGKEFSFEICIVPLHIDLFETGRKNMMVRCETEIRILIFGCVMQLMTDIGKHEIIQNRIKVQDRIRIHRMQPDIVEGE